VEATVFYLVVTSPTARLPDLMKTLLILFLVSMCIVAWRSDDVADMIQGVSAVKPMAMTGAGATMFSTTQQPVAVSLENIAEFGRNAPQAGRAFAEREQQTDRTGVDKMMNFLARGSFE
jgi:hypothetical protein